MHILGIHLDFPFVYTTRIVKRGRKIELLENKAHESDVKQFYIDNFKGRIISGLSAKGCLIRPLELKTLSQKHIEEALIFQAEATSHFNPADVLTIPFIQKKEKNSIKALMFTIQKGALRDHLSRLEERGIDPDAISTIPTALCHFVKWKFPDLQDAFIVHLGSNETTCALVEKGQLQKAYAIPIGVETLFDGLLEDRKKNLLKKDIEGAAKQLDLLLSKPGLNPNLTGRLNEIQQELTKIYHSFHRNIEKKPVIFTGRIDAFVHFREFLIDAPIKNFEEQKFAVSIGLALEQTSKESLQLRQQDFFPQKNWRKIGLLSLGLLSLSLLLSIGIFIFGSITCQQKKFEMLKLLPKSKGSVEVQINDWIATIEKNNKEYPFILQAPQVGEVLRWLSLHPLLNELKQEGDPIDLQEVRYQLVKFPKIGSMKEPYLAKIEIAFQFKSSMNARKFHEALRNGDDLVDSQMEITWDALNEGYRTSFFLKNRGPLVF